MNRSTDLFNRIHAFAALVLLALAVLFAACAPAPVPVTGRNSASKPASAVQAKPDVDLGAGYRLVTNAQGVQIVPPETNIRPADKTYDLGAGYRLVVTSSGGEIIPPARPNTTYKRVDLGAGYILEISGDYGYIIPPSSTFQPKVQDAPIHKEYLGDGFWLVTGPNGGQIVQEGPK